MISGPGGKHRCDWAGEDPLSVAYHDDEWGFPVHDDGVLFEFLVLESAQAGLSWMTILRKRAGYREAYDGFDPEIVANYDETKKSRLLKNDRIVRNKLKIKSSINNARCFLAVREEYGSFDAYLWHWIDGKQVVGGWKTMGNIPVSTELSDQISKDLKKRGFSFVGTTIIYSYLQAVGVVNDHITACFRFSACKQERREDE